ncbi:hypothetical protein BGX29_000535 [Mortierella sp. GBA35]|nr:hypothetical protein BGX29_000535 [Mortierella sp. GBA35]KAG0202091.1 hypothetical protein BGX33_009906 [Mortierella sp. NVP41]
MDPVDMDRTTDLDAGIGAGFSTPIRSSSEHIIPVDPNNNYAPFGAPWSGPSTPSIPSGMSIPGDSIFKNMSSPARSLIHSSEPGSSLRIDEEEDTLHIEKSRILEQLRHATAEVDQLESRLQAVRRRRARSVITALENHQKAQESEAKEMRNVLGSINELTISEAEKDATNASEQNRVKENVPVKTLLSTLASPEESRINMAMVQRLQSFTDIAFTSIENYVLTTSDTGSSKRQYRIAGLCFRLEFEVKFTVHEPALDLTDLQITLPLSVRQELGRFVASKSSPELVLQWTIEATEQGRIIPHVRLLPRMHKKWRQADEKGTLDAIPTQFARLMQLKGTEGAIAVLLQCVYGRKATEAGGARP